MEFGDSSISIRGRELVADGLAKPWHGQAFFMFKGMARRGPSTETVGEIEQEFHLYRGGNSAAMRTLVLGSMLLSALTRNGRAT